MRERTMSKLSNSCFYHRGSYSFLSTSCQTRVLFLQFYALYKTSNATQLLRNSNTSFVSNSFYAVFLSAYSTLLIIIMLSIPQSHCTCGRHLLREILLAENTTTKRVANQNAFQSCTKVLVQSEAQTWIHCAVQISQKQSHK